MSLTIAVLKETQPLETRVSCVPDTVKKLAGMNIDVVVASGAGERASYLDDAYKQAGASIAKSNSDAVKKASVVFCINSPDAKTLSAMAKGTLVIGALGPYQFADKSADYNQAGLTAIAMELMPRITRAQNMDILSSQSTLPGIRPLSKGRICTTAPCR